MQQPGDVNTVSPTKRRKVGEVPLAPQLFNARDEIPGLSRASSEKRPPAPPMPRSKNEVAAYLEAEIIQINAYHHFNTIGAFADLDPKERTAARTDVRFFASVVPDSLVSCYNEMSEATRTLLAQRLRLEFQRLPLRFRHQGRGIVAALTERQALLDLVTWLRGLSRPVRLFVHSREARVLPVLVGKLRQHHLYADFARAVVGVCDVTSLAWNRGYISLWIGPQGGRDPPDFGSLRAALTEGSSGVEAEESDELAELMGQLVNQVRETGTEEEKRDFLIQVRYLTKVNHLSCYFYVIVACSDPH